LIAVTDGASTDERIKLSALRVLVNIRKLKTENSRIQL
jgi:hypothetical protein